MRDEIALRKRWISAWPGSVSLIEPTIGSTPGFPDAFCMCRKEAGLVEFKVIDDDCVFELEPSQRLWLIENIPHYRRVIIVCMNEGGFYSVPAPLIVERGMPLRLKGCYGTMIPWNAPSLPSYTLQSAREAWSL